MLCVNSSQPIICGPAAVTKTSLQGAGVPAAPRRQDPRRQQHTMAAASHRYAYEWWETPEGYWTYTIKWCKWKGQWHSYKR